MPARPNSRIRPRPTTNGGVMIGSSESRLHRRLQALRAALGDQRQHRAEHGRADRREQGQEERVPGDAAAHAAGQAAPGPRCAQWPSRSATAASEKPAGIVDETRRRAPPRPAGRRTAAAARRSSTTAPATKASPRKLAGAGRGRSRGASAGRAGSARRRDRGPAGLRRGRRTPRSSRRTTSRWRRSTKPLPRDADAGRSTAPMTRRAGRGCGLAARRRPRRRARAPSSAIQSQGRCRASRRARRPLAESSALNTARIESSRLLVAGEVPRQEREGRETDAGPGDQRRPHPVAAGGGAHKRSM